MAEDLPEVLVLGPPTCFPTLEPLYSHKFHFLNHHASGLPLHQFLVAHSSIRAILCSTTIPLTADLLRLVPSLRLIVTSSSGTNHIDLNECRRRGILVADNGGAASEDVADMAVALLISVMRKLSAADRYVRTRNSSDPWDFPLGCKQTHHIINREVILALGKGGFIVNVGRGGLIDEKQLVKCLMEGEIGGAGLDVFENEPHVPQELLAMNNVVLSPHCGSLTVENRISLSELLAGNLEAFFSNKPLITPVKLVE
ncbi:glyoxylate/hydroxypyruvate reductase HPR3-like isoform X2 [Lotus japonicus]|uniref:glyoxylate/hydroxypyruvate reductase HPR3-like isoform X2 n=1 Tax=Lotus japonicus TaxID=34305 RepID=UPI002588B7BB|nr:glyoxylate/hydroxypyruvate reductase HPR3-like isoform X2 [Lotus japonicus]